MLRFIHIISDLVHPLPLLLGKDVIWVAAAVVNQLHTLPDDTTMVIQRRGDTSTIGVSVTVTNHPELTTKPVPGGSVTHTSNQVSERMAAVIR